ncbi:hypothetical protein [Piscirickettsia salmonis]|nr:hypothetical protein [Piscirickettsia salmonis]
MGVNSLLGVALHMTEGGFIGLAVGFPFFSTLLDTGINGLGNILYG